MQPFLSPLDAAAREQFLAAYTAKIVGAYKPRFDGKVLLRFPRLFILAVRNAATSVTGAGMINKIVLNKVLAAMTVALAIAAQPARADAPFRPGCNRYGRRRRRSAISRATFDQRDARA